MSASLLGLRMVGCSPRRVGSGYAGERLRLEAGGGESGNGRRMAMLARGYLCGCTCVGENACLTILAKR